MLSPDIVVSIALSGRLPDFEIGIRNEKSPPDIFVKPVRISASGLMIILSDWIFTIIAVTEAVVTAARVGISREIISSRPPKSVPRSKCLMVSILKSSDNSMNTAVEKNEIMNRTVINNRLNIRIESPCADFECLIFNSVQFLLVE